MKLVAPDKQIVIDAQSDAFNRDDFAKGILSLFERTEDPLVIALDEEWGKGKTVFSHRLSRFAKERGFKVVYFDSFARDYEPDAFVSLAAAAIAALPTSEPTNSELVDRAKAVGKVVSNIAFKGAIRLASAGALTMADLSDGAEEMAIEISNIAEAQLDKVIDERLRGAKKEEEVFSKFRETLSKIGRGKQGSEDKPVLFIVDELDRCKPDHALLVLETIKHFFSVKNVHFLLVCHVEQLLASISIDMGVTRMPNGT